MATYQRASPSYNFCLMTWTPTFQISVFRPKLASAGAYHCSRTSLNELTPVGSPWLIDESKNFVDSHLLEYA